MNNFYLLALRNLWTRKTRTLLTLSGVAIGVAFVLAVSITNASMRRSVESFFQQAAGKADLAISDAERQSMQTGFRASVLRQVQAFPGVSY